MRIKQIETAHFGKSELTIFNEFANKNKAFVATLTRNDIIVFVSKQGNQLRFVHNFANFGDNQIALQSSLHRIMRGTWNPLRLKDYASEVGLDIDGLRRFEEHYEHLLDASHSRK